MLEDVNQKTSQRSQELGAFLRVCRSRLTPQQVGLDPGERRRVDGLRREEVAALAGIGITWYTWLEQGRDIHVSSEVLNNLARVLQLSVDERSYLLTLARYEPSFPLPPSKSGAPREVISSVQTFLNMLYPYPAHLRDHHWDVLAWNRAELQLYPWEVLAPKERNLLVHIFTHPFPRQTLAHWEEHARVQQGLFRMALSRYSVDHRFSEIIAFLQQASREFRQWWQEYSVQHQPLERIEWHLPHHRSLTFTPFYLTLEYYPLLTIRVLQPQKSLKSSERFSKFDDQ